ncbi:MAG: transcription elongation factor GreA [Chloroflexota bacterium]
MFDTPIYITPSGMAKLEAELANLRNVVRPEILEQLEDAQFGSNGIDNTESLSIQDELAFVDSRIYDLEHILGRARVIDPGHSTDTIQIGSTAVLQGEGGEIEKYQIVGAAEADPGKGLISNESPLGRALLGHKAGNDVTVQAPAGTLRFHVIAVL